METLTDHTLIVIDLRPAVVSLRLSLDKTFIKRLAQLLVVFFWCLYGGLSHRFWQLVLCLVMNSVGERVSNSLYLNLGILSSHLDLIVDPLLLDLF